MDDNKFDQRIREKVAEYRDYGIDSGALEGLHQRLAGVTYALPWYKNLKNIGWIAASVILVSLLNFSLYSYIHGSDSQELLDELAQLRHDQQKLYELQNQLNNKENRLIDTVYVYKEKAVNTTNPPRDLEAVIATMNKKELNDLIQKYNLGAEHSGQKALPGSQLYMANLDDAPPEVRSYLARNGIFVFEDGKKVPVKIDNLPYQHGPERLRKRGYYLASNDWQPFFDIGIGGDEQEKQEVAGNAKKTKDVALPARILRVLEKNEMNGLGFRWGPELTLLRSAYDIGHGEGLQLGVLAELVMSPSLRLESGFKYTKLEFGLDDSEIAAQSEETLNTFPALNRDIGELEDIEVSSDIISIPLNLKYFYPLTKRKKMFVSVGYTPMLYLSQRLEYSYLADIGNDIEEDDFSTAITSTKRIDNPELYAGTFNTSLGLESQLKKDLYFQAALFYQKGITDMGVEERNIELFGLRTSLWFKVR
ncbi:hypothetical protein QQ020_11295 [Fulvivirgaceae bacterium BMA12]|uniref:Outer membrane protein beta-barrel domain-containing protein n=1 Tax=Agaribacillus aureus TaxID=3051825 RepID=A0ABT8L4F0_9BACT|nr:hypothetical protein [Fulvivirgaceae bacterium BMA12]